VIVGGVAGGASCAARARRLSETASITLLERGRHISFANCGMPYHIGGQIADRRRLLVQTSEGMRTRFRIDVRIGCEATGIDRQNRTVAVHDLASGVQYSLPYDALVLSPGAEPIRPDIPGADLPGVFTLRSLADMDAIKAAAEACKSARAVILGGGYIGLEMAEALRDRQMEVSLVQHSGQVMTALDAEMAAPLNRELALHGVDLHLGATITAIGQHEGGLRVTLSTGESIVCGLVILSVGVRPEAKLARDAGLAIGSRGGIVVDDHMRTSDEAIFAVGDAIEVKHFLGGQQTLLPLAGPANRQGRIAADNIFDRPSVYHGSQGTAICKVFGLAVGLTGLSEKELRRLGRPYDKVYVHPASHASYYPGASPLSLKLLFDPQDGKILGAQAIGSEGVDKRLDVLAVAIRAGLTVRDLRDMELCYAPPYGSAKDPINYAGFVATNVLDGDVASCHAQACMKPAGDQVLLDVRTPEEVEAGTIPGARNIPLDQLRERLGELPRDKEILAFCQVGLRGYLGCRILKANGFRCRNLSGGYKTYKDFAAAEAAKNQTIKAAPANETTPGGCTAQPASAEKVCVTREIDARGLQCPGPIMRLKEELAKLTDGQAVRILVGDNGFPADVAAWCHSTGHQLREIVADGGHFRATIVKGQAQPAAAPGPASAEASRPTSIVVFSGDFDKAMAAFIIANGAAAMGSEVTMFFTFWGLNILRKGQKVQVRKNLVERMFGWMMPRGPEHLKLSKMNLAGCGTAMIKGIMRKKNVASLGELIQSARQAGVKLVACSMSMGLMGIHREELIDGVEEGGVASYLGSAERGNVNLFI
jgi:NADPH-dependent 2,4-dienoyl-CoA reductase/sulfur reductase-like enzyme/peroxiredoxin family protein/rhodanese-related sulfurtransferase/TusA-related sulfurtransferase